jgi:hypothetical protein
MSNSSLEVHDSAKIADDELQLVMYAAKKALYPDHPDMRLLRRSMSWYDGVIAYHLRAVKSGIAGSNQSQNILETMAARNHAFDSEAIGFTKHNRKYMLSYLSDYAAKKATEAVNEVSKTRPTTMLPQGGEDDFLEDGTHWILTIPSAVMNELAWHDPVMLAEKKKAIIQQTNGKSDFELSNYFHNNLRSWSDAVDAEIATRRAANPDLADETFRLQNLELLEHRAFLTSTLAWVGAKTAQTIVTGEAFPALEYDAPVPTEPVVSQQVLEAPSAPVNPATLPVLSEKIIIPAATSVTDTQTTATPAPAPANALDKLEIQHLETMKSIILGELNARSGDSLTDYYVTKLKPATSDLKSNIEAAKARGNDNPDYLAARERQLSVMLELSSLAATKINNELQAQKEGAIVQPQTTPVALSTLGESTPAEALTTAKTVTNAPQVFEDTGEKMPMPETIAPAPQKKSLGAWLKNTWTEASQKTKALIVAAGSALALGGAGLATAAFNIAGNNAPEAPTVPVAMPTATIVVGAEPKTVGVTPPAPMVAAAPAPVVAEPVAKTPASPEAKTPPISLAKKSFTPVVNETNNREITAKPFDILTSTSSLETWKNACNFYKINNVTVSKDICPN